MSQNQQNNPFGDGAKEQHDNEFWKPENSGDFIAGKVVRRFTTRHGESIELSAAVIGSGLGKNRRHTLYAGYNVGVNSSLERKSARLTPGAFVGIVFNGYVDTQNGKMREYGLFVLTAEKYAEMVKLTGQEPDDLPF